MTLMMINLEEPLMVIVPTKSLMMDQNIMKSLSRSDLKTGRVELRFILSHPQCTLTLFHLTVPSIKLPI